MKECPYVSDVAWYRNGSLPAEDRRRFEQHLRRCRACQAELAFDERLEDNLRATAAKVLPAPQLAWRRLEARLDAAEPAVQEPRARPRSRILQVVVAAQAAAILLLVGVLWSIAWQPEVQPYRTMGAPDVSTDASVPLVRVVLAPGHTESAVTMLAESLGAEVAGRYEGTEIYTFAVRVAPEETRAGRVAEVLSTLRRHPDVRMAEPVTDPQVASDSK